MTPELFHRAPVAVVGWGRGWVVVEKPSGMSVHNLPGQDLCSVMTEYIGSDRDRSTALALEPDFGINPVHRLDKETSGLMLLAANRTMFRYFSEQFVAGGVTKHYQALLHGRLIGAQEVDRWQCWQRPLTQKAGGRNAIDGQGIQCEALTFYRVLRHTAHYTLAECRLDTGRTHQIRRHAALAGHAVVGDQRYGSKRACRYLEQQHGFTRLGLHASLLALTIPESRESVTFTTDQLPAAMRQLMEMDAHGSESRQ